MKLFVPVNNQSINKLCIYHRVDMDGKCSGAIVNYCSGFNTSNTWFLGCNYEKDFSIYEILEAFPNIKEMFILDYSIEPEDVIKVIDKGISLVWCDHHKTAIEKYEQHPRFRWCSCPLLDDDNILELEMIDPTTNERVESFRGLLSYKYSGALLTYKFFQVYIKRSYSDDIRKNMASVSMLVSTYDTWDHSDETAWELAYSFNQASKLGIYNPTDTKWVEMFGDMDVISNMIHDGRIIAQFTEITNRITAKAYAGTLEWEGLRFCAINRMGNSIMVNSVFDPEIHDAVLCYMYSPREGLYKVSLYSNDNLPEDRKEQLDLSVIATKFNGGGHKLACGFSCYELPFSIYDIKPI